MSTSILEGKAEFIKSSLDALIASVTTIHFITKLEAGKVLVVYTV